MSFLDRLIEKYSDVFAPTPDPVETAAIERDRFDEASYAEVLENVPAIKKQIVEISTEHSYVSDFTEDFYNLALKADPTVRPTSEMAPTHAPNASMIQSFADMPEMQQLRTMTANDQYASAMAVVAMGEDIKEAYVAMAEARERAEELAQQRAEAQAAAQAARDAAQAAADAEGTPGQGDAEAAAEEAAEAAQKQQATTADMQQALQDAMDAAEANMKPSVKSAAKAAADAAEEESELMSAFGVEPGDLKKMDFNERKSLAERLKNNRLAKFAALIGAFRQMAAAEQRRRVATVADEVVGVKLGDDLMRLTPQEMVNLATPETETDFWYRYTSKSLLVFEMAGNERQGKGPIIAVCDESGSMTAPFGPMGSREAWSKAFALSLCDQARRQNRDFHYIGFSSPGQVWSLSFPSGRAELSQVIDMTEHFWGGGTEYEEPLGMALDIMEEHYASTGLAKPDVVFISDDEYGSLDPAFMHRWNATKDRTGLRCFGVAIAAGYGGAMASVCDDVRSLLDMTSDPREVRDIFRTI